MKCDIPVAFVEFGAFDWIANSILWESEKDGVVALSPVILNKISDCMFDWMYLNIESQ